MLNYISAPFKWFFKLEAASGLILLISAILALIISNSSFSELYFSILEKYILIVFNYVALLVSTFSILKVYMVISQTSPFLIYLCRV